jgi:hypothetical protein
MTSQIDFNAIDETYPKAGVDNDTQGFRDNFSAAKTALATAKSEITELQTFSVLTKDLTTDNPKTNDLAGSTISNGLLKQMNGVVKPNTIVTSNEDIDLNDGPLQVFTIGAGTEGSPVPLTFRNWPDAVNQYSLVRIHLKGDGEAVRYPTFVSENARPVIYETGFPSLALATNGKHKVIEAWTITSGSTPVYIRYIGEF